MFRLRDLKNGVFQIHSQTHGAFEGPLNPIYWQAVDWGICPKELSIAVKTLRETGHDYAEFGFLGCFLYSAKNKKAS